MIKNFPEIPFESHLTKRNFFEEESEIELCRISLETPVQKYTTYLNRYERCLVRLL